MTEFRFTKRDWQILLIDAVTPHKFYNPDRAEEIVDDILDAIERAGYLLVKSP